MAKVILNATDVRNDFFNLVNLIAKTGEPIFVRKNKEVVIKMEPVDMDLEEDRVRDMKRWLDVTRGMWAGRSEEEIRGRFKEADKKTTQKIRNRRW